MPAPALAVKRSAYLCVNRGLMGYHSGHPKECRVAQTEPTRDKRLFIHNLVKRDPLAGLADDVRKGLTSQHKRFLP